MIGTLTKIVSGAQTGADRGALDAALAAGLQIGGWAPSGWVYDVPGKPSVAHEYRPYMRMTTSQTTGMVARLNVQDSDATLLLSFAHELTGHEEFVLRQVKAQRKPCKHLVLPRGRGVVPAEVTSAVWEWLQAMRVGVLNVAGPRESKEPGIQAASKRVIAGLLNAKRDADTAAALALQDAEADATMATESAQAAEERAESLRRMIDMGLQMRTVDDMYEKMIAGYRPPGRPDIAAGACADCGASAGMCKPECATYQFNSTVFRSAFANKGEGIKEAAKTGVLRMMCPDCGSREPCACAFHAYARATLGAAKEALDRKDELFASGKYREAGGPIQGFNLEHITQRVTFEGEDLLSRLHDKERKHRSSPTPQESLPVEDEDDDLEFFIASCAAATTAEDFTRKNIGLIDCYYGMDGNSDGGSLHIVLDDGNHERDSVQFCLDWAIREGDKAGEALARALLALPDEVYVQVLPPFVDTCLDSDYERKPA